MRDSQQQTIKERNQKEKNALFAGQDGDGTTKFGVLRV